MDYEEVWRAAMEEAVEQQRLPTSRTSATHDGLNVSLSSSHETSVPPGAGGLMDGSTRVHEKPPPTEQQQAGDTEEGGGHGSYGAGDDGYDEFSDGDLLQSVPFANDASFIPEFAQWSSRPPAVTDARHLTREVPECNVLGPTPSPATVVLPSTALPSTSPRGVLEFPPLGVFSFLLRGDDGQVRWVTTTGAHGRAAPLGRKAGAWEGAQAPYHPSSHEVGVGVEAAGCEDVVDRLHIAEGTLPLGGSGAAMQLSDDEDDGDVSKAGMQCAEHRASNPTGFFRDGVNVQAMLRKIYTEEMKEKQRRVQQEEEERERRRRDAQRTSLKRSHDEMDALSDGDEVMEEGERERRRFVGAPRQSDTTSAGAVGRHGKPSRSSDGELWVTKYAPKLFREVLSDETINLQLLQWLKSWDAYVFPDDATPADRGASASAPVSSSTASPPGERIAILTGPPGVGKTTLVHVLAAHCGYEVIEVNASVERTSSRLEALIKTAVSAAGPAPGGRLRRLTAPSVLTRSTVTAFDHDELGDENRKSSSAGSAAAVASAASSSQPSSSLVHYLLRPKCLVIDEMDGIASSSVATFLIQQSIHRPVFCLCNDLYVPSLRPLRQRCSHVYHMPPIRPQRLLTRLDEISRREGATIFDSMVLSELITTAGGDVRSCLNAMQFISSIVHQQQQQQQTLEAGPRRDSSSPSTAPVGSAPSRHTVAELMRRMQVKDTRVALRDTWHLLLNRLDRNRAVQFLKQDYGVDYGALVEAAAAQHTRSFAPAGPSVGRGRETEAPKGEGSVAAQATEVGQEEGIALTRAITQPVARGFRVDPGYLYAARKISRCPDNSGLVDGLQENYLNRPYTDYSFSRTSATAHIFSSQDVTAAAAFRHPGMMGTAERLCQVAALTCYVHCSTAARGGRIEFPREQATLRRLQSEAQHISQQFREGCHPHIATFISGDEITSTDVVPMLLRCLFDRSLRLPAHAISSFSCLSPADQRLLHTSVVRHVEYGLDYHRDRQHTPSPAAATADAAAGPSVGSSGFFGALNAVDEGQWRLAPELEKLLGGVVRPMEHALLGRSGGSGYRTSYFSRSARFGGSGTNGGGHHAAPHAPGVTNGHGLTNSRTGSGDGRDGGSNYSSVSPRALPLASVMMPIRNEVRQVLSGAINQYRVTLSAVNLKRSLQQLATEKSPLFDSSTRAPERGPKRPRAEVESSATAVSSAFTHKVDAAVHDDVGPGGYSTAEVNGATGKRSETHGSTSEAPATTTATTVRRDFFGRPILSTTAGMPAATSTSKGARGDRGRVSGAATKKSVLGSSSSAPASSVSAGQGSVPRSHTLHNPTMSACVRYVYQDGSTNAVKMPATFADF